MFDMNEQNIIGLLKSFTEEDFEKDVDLHIHSCFSDGHLTPDELVADAESKGLRYIAIADHNTVNAYLETDILKNPKVVPAIEFDCWYQGVLVHILGYGIDVTNKELLKHCAKDKKGRSCFLQDRPFWRVMLTSARCRCGNGHPGRKCPSRRRRRGQWRAPDPPPWRSRPERGRRW